MSGRKSALLYLVDASVWIDNIQGREAKQVDFLDDLMKNPLAVGVSDLIYMEVLQASKNRKHLIIFEAILVASNSIALPILN